MCVDSPSAIFNLERFGGQWVEHVVVNRGNAGLGTVSTCLICVVLVLSTRCLYLTTMDMLGMSAVPSWRCGTTKSGKRKSCCQFPPAQACNRGVVNNLREKCKKQPREPLLPHGHTARMWARGAVWET
jgi:hypothetical protein